MVGLEQKPTTQEARIYLMFGLCAEVLPDKSLRVRGVFGEENLV